MIILQWQQKPPLLHDRIEDASTQRQFSLQSIYYLNKMGYIHSEPMRSYIPRSLALTLAETCMLFYSIHTSSLKPICQIEKTDDLHGPAPPGPHHKTHSQTRNLNKKKEKEKQNSNPRLLFPANAVVHFPPPATGGDVGWCSCRLHGCLILPLLLTANY